MNNVLVVDDSNGNANDCHQDCKKKAGMNKSKFTQAVNGADALEKNP